MVTPRLRIAQLTRWTVLTAFAALYGCAGAGPAPEEFSGEFDQMQVTIFNQNCLGGGCHNAQSQAGGLNLSAGASYNALVNVVPTNPVAAGMGLLRVQPSNPDNSFLLIKLTGPAAGEGSRMPQGMNPLPQSDIDEIRQWILNGAPPPGTLVPTAPATATPTESAVATATAIDTVTPTPVNTGTPTVTVTGTAPATSTPSATGTVTETPSPSPTPSETSTPSMFQQIQTTIFNPTCTTSFCHDVQGMSGGLVLVEGVSYGNLVGVPPSNAPARAAGFLRVDPGNTENSFLLLKVTGPMNPVYGLRMPSGMPPLSADQIELISNWIASGAAE